MLFAEWVMGTDESSRANELFESLGVCLSSASVARRNAYVSMLAAIVLDERSRGTTIMDLERRWDLTGLDGIEETLRDTVLWLLVGHVALFEVRCFYHHLREDCTASIAQTRIIKHSFNTIRGHAYDLLESLKYCSPLGSLVRHVRNSLRKSKSPTLGEGTIRKLEAAGFVTLQQIATLDVDAMVAAGIQKRFAMQIRAYTRQRLK
jgi:helicase